MDEQFRKAFSRNLKYYMAKEGKTQADMVKYMKISPATASDWCNERKIPRADKLQAIANWFGISLLELTSDGNPYDRTTAANDDWYSDQTVKRIAERMKADKDYQVFFEAASNIRREDLDIATQIIKRLAR